MNVFKKAANNVSDYMVDHPTFKKWSVWIGKFFLEVISAFIFAYGFRAFISPNLECVEHWTGTYSTVCTTETSCSETTVVSLISGGASGISQVIVKIIECFPVNIVDWEQTLISVFYFVINIPLLLIAWFKISKQFTVFTLINVGLVSLFNQFIPDAWIYNVVNIYEDYIARSIFAGITTGVASGLSLMVGTSSGGVDIISMYISNRRSTSSGKYSITVNTCVVLCYVLFSAISLTTNPEYATTESVDSVVTMALYTIVYFFVSGTVVDLFNTRNKKQEIQIFTSDKNLPTVLVRAFPHAATVVDARGAYTNSQNYIIYMVVSKKEVKQAVKIIKEADKLAFVTVLDINQVYGNFYIAPIE